MTATLQLPGHLTDLAGGLRVRRLLPAAARRAVGPFVFFDHFGPAALPAETDSDIGAHPHIGLATVTYLFEGSLLHRDSLGTVQAIRPGAINWMTAGRGIVHSERATDDERGRPRRLHGLQLWVALPPALEASEPAFQHVPAADLPTLSPAAGVRLRLLVGEAFGERSPVRTASPTLYLDLRLDAGARWTLPPLAAEMALYAPQQGLGLDGQALPAQTMAVLPAGQGAELRADAAGAQLVVIGGAPLVQPVRMWWNFVASDRERIAEAARRWAADGFDAIPGETARVAAPPWHD
ncbi:MAG: pirin family protein [Burkholderiaceae bacterium]|nr:pirin family protein [Burkholderiaceae bacterium]